MYKRQSPETRAALRDCTEAELLAELVARRTRGRLGRDPRVGHDKSRTAVADLGDAELRADVVELNAFCSADGCARTPAAEDDE